MAQDFKKAIKTNARFRFVVSETERSPDFQHIYVDETTVSIIQRQLTSKYANSLIDVSDAECQFYSELKGNSIANVKLVISSHLSDFDQQKCMAVGVLRGIGLSIFSNDEISKILLTAKPSGYSDLDESEFATLVQGSSIYTFIHMCPALKSGMTIDEVSSVMTADPQCLVGLKIEKKN